MANFEWNGELIINTFISICNVALLVIGKIQIIIIWVWIIFWINLFCSGIGCKINIIISYDLIWNECARGRWYEWGWSSQCWHVHPLLVAYLSITIWQYVKVYCLGYWKWCFCCWWIQVLIRCFVLLFNK